MIQKILIVLLALVQILEALEISHKIDNQAYSYKSAIYLIPHQKLHLKFDGIVVILKNKDME